MDKAQQGDSCKESSLQIMVILLSSVLHESHVAKTRITIHLDKNILDLFRKEVHKRGGGNYQTLINDALQEYIDTTEGRLAKIVRKAIREELKHLKKISYLWDL